ncbi:alpha/beta hydrolase [Priestia megaterium]
MPYIKFSGVNIYYETINFNNLSTENVSLLIHGAGGSSVHWYPLIKKLRSDIPIITVDLPGHGISEGLVLEDISCVNEFILYLSRKLKINKFNLIGHSLGGLIALNFTINYPRLVNKIALICSSDYINLHPDFLMQARKNSWDMKIQRNGLSPNIPPEKVHLILDELYKIRMNEKHTDFMNTSNCNLRNLSHLIKNKVIIITSKNDIIISPRHSRNLAKKIQNSQLVELAVGSHYVHVEYPNLIAEKLNIFLK